MSRKASDKYFDRYSALQRYKHDLLKRYLGGWFPIIANAARRIVYIETHAGRGRHTTGDLGSPLIALQAFLGHPQRDRIVSRSQVLFYLFEKDSRNHAALQQEIENVLPTAIPNCKVEIGFGEAKDLLRSELDTIDQLGERLAPAFVFVDPFNYDVPVEFVQRILRYPSCEVMVTFMAQQVARAMGDASKAPLLDSLYGSDTWRTIALIDGFKDRTAECIDLYKKIVGARYCTTLRLVGQAEYALMHFTNHPKGRWLMKRAMWAKDNTGRYQVVHSDDPRQLHLFTIDPDLQPFEDALRTQFGGRTVLYSELEDFTLDSDYLDTHLHTVLANGRNKGWLVSAHKGPFGPSVQVPITIEASLWH